MLNRLNAVTSPKILCVDDDSYLTELLHYALSRDGYSVTVANHGAEALRIAQTDPPDIVVLDLHLPDMNGLALCAQLRRQCRLPVILLTASHSDGDVITGFQHGADDYVYKPFSMQILSYRIQAVLRRTRGMQAQGGPVKMRYELGSGTFDAEQHEVLGKDMRIKLTPTQGKILHLLLENDGRVISPEQIMNRIWHYEAESDISVVKTHISNLRKRLAVALGTDDIIRTVAGLGYTLQQKSGNPTEI